MAAKNATLSIPMNAISSRSGERGDFHVVKIAIPDDVVSKRVDTVLLEFAVDAVPISEEDTLATPLVGVYPLTREVTSGLGEGSGTLDPTAYSVNVSSVRPVVVGQKRTLRVDITDIVKGWLLDPSSNHGLVIGSLAGPNVGMVSLRSGALASGASVRVTFFYQDRYGGRTSVK